MAATLNETTISGAITAADDRVALASGATVAAGHIGYIDKEAVTFLQRVFPGNDLVWLVSRGQHGTPAIPHKAAAKIKTGPAGHFGAYDRAGAADVNTELVVPYVNVLNGNVFDINAGAWRQVGVNGVAQGTAAWP